MSGDREWGRWEKGRNPTTLKDLQLDAFSDFLRWRRLWGNRSGGEIPECNLQCVSSVLPKDIWGDDECAVGYISSESKWYSLGMQVKKKKGGWRAISEKPSASSREIMRIRRMMKTEPVCDTGIGRTRNTTQNMHHFLDIHSGRSGSEKYFLKEEKHLCGGF